MAGGLAFGSEVTLSLKTEDKNEALTVRSWILEGCFYIKRGGSVKTNSIQF